MLFLILAVVFYIAGVLLFIRKGLVPVRNGWSNAGRVWAQAGWIMLGVLPISMYRAEVIEQTMVNQVAAIIYLVSFALVVPFMFIKAMAEHD